MILDRTKLLRQRSMLSFIASPRKLNPHRAHPWWTAIRRSRWTFIAS
jgi:hypothetical protein